MFRPGGIIIIPKGVSLREPIETRVPTKLKPYLADLGRMHHIQKPKKAARAPKN